MIPWLKKWSWRLFWIVIVFGLIATYFSFFTYSTGSRVGTIVKYSQKGWIFKTHEGTLQLGAQSSNTWNFSVSDARVSTDIQKAMDKQLKVKLTYKEAANKGTNETPYEVITVDEVK